MSDIAFQAPFVWWGLQRLNELVELVAFDTKRQCFEYEFDNIGWVSVVLYEGIEDGSPEKIVVQQERIHFPKDGDFVRSLLDSVRLFQESSRQTKLKPVIGDDA
ncbi:hypothetical protein EIP86_009057 [Pleurotus ostreatoroseus]|nr:hypothetical protein EIP86_009057 [Pleurotus ostreatoroseus]